MTLTRAVTSAVDGFAARLAAIAERVVNLERQAHRHNTPQTGLQPAGSVQFWISDTPPAGWALLNGQTLTNAETIYPDLWAVTPVQFKSGANIILPDCRGRVMVGRSNETEFNQVGATGGEKQVILDGSNLPTHSHGAGNLFASSSGTLSMSGSTSISGNTGSAGSHEHAILTDNAGQHSHGLGAGVGIAFVTGLSPTAYGSTTPTLFGLRESGPWQATGTGAGLHAHGGGTTTEGSHQHSFSGSGSVNVSGASHFHTVGGAVGNSGASAPHQNLQPYLTLTPIIKLV